MEKKEAAEFLGVSVRTLDRLAVGNLTKGRARKKTRPVVVFDENELIALKEKLNRTDVSLKEKSVVKPQDAIGFRLDPSYVKRLIDEGEKVGMSPGEFARRLVIRGLEDDSTERFAKELKAFRQNLTDMFFLILISKLGASEEEAAKILKTLSEGT